MKGQFNIEYLVALAIFIILMVFVSSQIAQTVPELHAKSVSGRLDSKIHRITDTLVKTTGNETNWQADPSAVRSIGLVDENFKEQYLLSNQKIDALNSLCASDYNKIRGIFGLKPGSDFTITIAVDGDLRVNCIQRAPLNVIRAISRRYAATSTGGKVELVMSMW